MNILHDMSPKEVSSDKFTAVIEIPRGSKVKYELDKATGLLRVDRILYTSTHYPANYGFIPRTHADDGDPLDVLVLCSETLFPMSLVTCYPIGVITMMDNGAKDEKIICIPLADPSYNDYTDISELPSHIFDEMKHFFTVYKQLEHKDTLIDDVHGAQDAKLIIAQCIDNYIEKFCK
ncbi:MAG: inorganic diphosphatase [Ruminococcus sp.]|nr:inorganic diphosphatase [Ruminococcus sp.]